MSYQQYGISPVLVDRVKRKLKKPAVKEKVTALLDGVTKKDLQNQPKVTTLLGKACRILQEPLSQKETQQIVQFIIDLRIDPRNTFQLIKLWAMFR